MEQRQPKLIVNVTRGNILCEAGTIADRIPARMKGLLGRSELRWGEGLLLSPANSIHTAFMRFPIDAAFLDGELRVLKVVPSIKPWRAALAHDARSVLELAAGEAELRGLHPGDQLSLLELHPHLHTSSGASA